MLATNWSRALERAASDAAITLPGFLVPAFQTSSQRRQFSSTANASSKLGRTPISIPPGVEITIGDLKTKKDPTTYLQIPKRTVTVSGPLGKLDLVVPHFLTIQQDLTASKAMLTIEDKNLKQQKEMWGT
jgi:large subunit ribosomal protein L6